MVQHLFRSLCTAWPRWFHQFTLSYTNYSPWKCLPTVNVQGLRLTVSLREGVTTIAAMVARGQGQAEIHLMQASREAKGDFEDASPASPMVTWHERSPLNLVKKIQWHQRIIRWLCSLNIRFFGDMTFSFKDFLGWLFCCHTMCPVMSFDRQFLQIDHAKTCNFFLVWFRYIQESTYHGNGYTHHRSRTSHRTNPDSQGDHFVGLTGLHQHLLPIGGSPTI